MWATDTMLPRLSSAVRSSLCSSPMTALMPALLSASFGMPVSAAPGQAQAQAEAASPGSINVEGLPRPGPHRHGTAPKPLDLEAIARGYAEQAGVPPVVAVQSPQAQLLILISFAMPEASLARLIQQAQASGATLVLRGLVDGSMRETVKRVHRLLGTRAVPVQIDPRAFERYAVSAVPAFVLIKSPSQERTCQQAACANDEAFALVQGDVSVDHALRFIARRSPGLGQAAGSLLGQLQEGTP